MPARTRVFLDALQAEFSGPRCQAEQEKVEAAKRSRQIARDAALEVSR
jgi:hypothetical protein